MYEKPLFWIEAMSILGKADEVSAILEEVIEWPALAVCPEFVFYNTILRLTGQTLDPMNELTLFIRDAVRFISAFLMPISQHPPQIYLSALPFTFERSLVDEKFRPRFPNLWSALSGRQMKRLLLPYQYHCSNVQLCTSATLKQVIVFQAHLS